MKENFPQKKPFIKNISWTNEQGKVTLQIENKGIFNFLAQKLLKKPKISYIHLDDFGSFVWTKIDGETDIVAIGKEVEAKFGEKANPLYERLSQYLKTLKSYGFIDFK